MSRKRTPDDPSSEPESTTATATAQPEPAGNPEPKQSFAERVGQRTEWVSAPGPFEIATDRVAGGRLFTPPPERHIDEGSFFVGDGKVNPSVARWARRARRL